MLQPGRQFTAANSTAYRYGFNGKENDNDINLGVQDYGMRIYDSRIGKFLSVDPIAKEYPGNSPYSYAEGDVIRSIDLDGLEKYVVTNSNFFGPTSRPTPYVPTTTFAKISVGTAKGVYHSIKGTVNFLASDAYKGSTWKNTGEFFTQFAYSMSTVKVYNTPMIDAKSDEFINKVIKGDAYSRSEYLGEFGTNLFTAYLLDKGIGEFSKLPMFTAASKVIGKWVSESTAGWSQRAIEYQEYVTGVKAGNAYEVNGVRFDNFEGNKLIEAKSSYDNFVNKSGEFYSWFEGADGLVDQARRQIQAAGGATVEWNFASEKTFQATQKLFKDNGVEGITLKYNPKKP